MPNQLAAQTSPYLLQHAHNPVDWHPWCESALRLAREQEKPILLSIGYAACHWCHVMERESFEDAEIAARMNKWFVCIKVDREERPDLDKIYQSAHQMLTQRPGGWPLTLALTPHGHAPFFAGTYFPPQARMGMPGFGEVVEQVAAHYRQHRGKMHGHHAAFAEAMAHINPRAVDAKLPAAESLLTKGVRELGAQFDAEFGGFGGAPKFPHPTQLELILSHAVTTDSAESKNMLEVTLRKMACGGLFDQLGGGFYRYSVDRSWTIPHFEKMLYDNAQLLSLYANALQCGGGALCRTAVTRTAEWVLREMQQPHGGYASTLDADSEGTEGKFYVWDADDMRAILQAEEYAAVETHYALAGEPNFEGKWHLTLQSESEHAFAEPPPALVSAQQKLRSARATRIRPGLDDKILTAWNGLMIKGMARAAIALGDDAFADSAARALDFVRANLWRGGRLFVTTRNGRASLNAYLDDYAFLAEGIIELLQAKWRTQDLALAEQLCNAMRKHFEDDDGGFFFTSHDHEALLHRPKTGADDAIPAGNAAAVRALSKLGHLLGNTAYLQSAEKALQLFAPTLAKIPSIHGALLTAHQEHTAARTIILRAEKSALPAWQKTCRTHAPLGAAIFAIPNSTPLPPALAPRKPHATGAAYICTGMQCKAAVTSREELAEVLAERET